MGLSSSAGPILLLYCHLSFFIHFYYCIQLHCNWELSSLFSGFSLSFLSSFVFLHYLSFFFPLFLF
jgi:hypothetical protein